MCAWIEDVEETGWDVGDEGKVAGCLGGSCEISASRVAGRIMGSIEYWQYRVPSKPIQDPVITRERSIKVADWNRYDGVTRTLARTGLDLLDITGATVVGGYNHSSKHVVDGGVHNSVEETLGSQAYNEICRQRTVLENIHYCQSGAHSIGPMHCPRWFALCVLVNFPTSGSGLKNLSWFPCVKIVHPY